MQAAGAEIVHLTFDPMQRAFAMAGPLYTADAYGWWKNRIEAAPEKMFHQILKRVRAGAEVRAADYLAAWTELRAIRAAWQAATAGYDAVIIPTLANLPPKVADLENDADLFVSENLLTLRNTRVANLMGLCALTVPTGVPSCGIMFNAGPGKEAALLRLGAAAEAALA
jgi:aspartyl-tRNA(Asn)/glutamyl-tRNA(Gln) amidotransferase subunit A